MSLKETIIKKLIDSKFKDVKVAIDRDSQIHGRPATQVEVGEQIDRILRTHEFKFAKDLGISQGQVADIISSFMTKERHRG